jgi:dolichol kinase
VLSLAALLFIFALYLKQSFLLYFRPHQYHYDAGIGSAIFLGVCGYLVSGFFNDSVVSVAPLFWIFLGLGFSINNKYKKLIHEGHKAR